METIETTLAALGFQKHFQVEGRTRVRDLFTSQICGIYVLHFQNGEYLIGQTTDIVQCFSQQARKFTDIQEISFKPVKVDRLEFEEKRISRTIENEGWLIRNPNAIVRPASTSLLEDVIPQDIQELWLSDMDFDDLEGYRRDDPNVRRNYHDHYLKLLSMPDIDATIAAVGVYVTSTIPAPKRTEMLYWNVACTTGSENLPVIRVNVGMQMTLEVRFNGDRTLFWIYLPRDLLADVLPFPLDQIDERMSLQSLPEWKIDESDSELEVGIQAMPTRTGSEDKLAIVVVYPYDLMRLTAFLQPYMRSYNLGLMQKSRCPWGKNHCLDLADHLFLNPEVPDYDVDEDETLEST